MTTTATTTYSSLRGSLNTGDIILFRGFDFTGFLIDWLETEENISLYTHIGIVITELNGEILPGPYIWQAAPPPDAESYGNDYLKGTTCDGCQLVSLDAVMSWCEQKINEGYYKDQFLLAARQLQSPITADMAGNLNTFIREIDGRSFSDPVSTGMPIDYYKGARDNEQTSNATFFCSKLASATFLAAGVINPVITNSILPGDFGEQNTGKLSFIEPYTLGPEIPFTPS